jgi:hypothetical protein
MVGDLNVGDFADLPLGQAISEQEEIQAASELAGNPVVCEPVGAAGEVFLCGHCGCRYHVACILSGPCPVCTR